MRQSGEKLFTEAGRASVEPSRESEAGEVAHGVEGGRDRHNQLPRRKPARAGGQD